MLITISDVHHGSKPYEEMYNEFYYEDGFMEIVEQLSNEKDFIGVAILGDWFDKKLDANDPKYLLAVNIVIQLSCMLCAKNKYLLILRGTFSHDLQQLSVFEYLTLAYPKYFLFFDTVGIANLKGKKTLVLPEEYPEDYNEFYKDYINSESRYDIILGHGYFSWNSFSVNEAEKSLPKMPIHDENLFCKMSPLTIFGHDHTFKNYKNKIFYGGSFSRLCQNEEAPKGFLYIEWENKKPIVHQIENTEAPLYKSYDVTKFIKTKDNTVNYESIVKNIEVCKNKYSIKKLRVTIPSEFSESHPEVVDLLRNYFSSKEGIDIKKNKSIEKKKDEKIENNESSSELDFLLSELSIVDKIYEFNLIKNPSSTLTKEQIINAISNQGK